MKKYISTLFVFTFLHVFSQSYKVVYEKNVSFSGNQGSDLPDDIRAKMKNVTILYSLYINSNQSLFTSGESFLGSSSSENGAEKSTTSYTMRGAKYNLYKNLKNNSFYLETELEKKDCNVADTLPDMAWKITDETDTVLGYTVKKAIGQDKGKEVVVWYTEQIPVKDGPMFYRGVSGLVLKAQIGKTIYTATKIEKAQKEKIHFPTSKDVMTLEEYSTRKAEEQKRNLMRLQP